MARDLVSCGFIQGAVESGYSRFVCATKLVRRFMPALRLVKMLNDEAASEDSSATGGVLKALMLMR